MLSKSSPQEASSPLSDEPKLTYSTITIHPIYSRFPFLIPCRHFLKMASGFGYSGGRTRCFPFWQEFSKCYANAEKPSDCVAPKDDYMECLHNTKEIARAKQVKSHFVQKELQESHDSRKAAEKAATGVIVSLGLVEEEGK
ncbi:hypothetical protein CNBI3140 [Cryptococcus deneoformans B-3501A]|nr:hypothetical protein CNBI3140 [Cryptococcus neoformans var. neoformans B-3501A]EAL18728.1 hypothetical protein CNBI3140 [Cryptococcus neoformans var. neoformans B-3501A]